MEKATLRKIILVLIALLTANDIAKAEGNYATLSVSCTIPAIPGVNVPPYETKESPDNNRQTSQETTTAPKKDAKDNPEQAGVIVEKNEGSSGLIKTIYSR